MYFKEFDNLNAALEKVKLELIPAVQSELSILCANSNQLGDEEQCEELFSIIVFKLKNDIDSMLRLVDLLLFPLIDQIVRGHINEHKIESFATLRFYHERFISNINELRNLCNNYVAITIWSNTKKRVCLNLFYLEQSLLRYINFMENTIFPLLMSYNSSTLLIK